MKDCQSGVSPVNYSVINLTSSGKIIFEKIKIMILLYFSPQSGV